MQNALKNYFPPLESGNARVEFYNKFKREADDYDNDFLKKYGGDLDITLIFVGLLPFIPIHFGRDAKRNRLLCSPRLCPLSSLPSRPSCNQITRN